MYRYAEDITPLKPALAAFETPVKATCLFDSADETLIQRADP